MLSSYTALIDGRAQRAEFEGFYMQNRKIGLLKAYSVLKDKADAEDALSEAFLRLAKSYSRVKALPAEKLQAYFVIIVRNVAIDMLRCESGRQRVELDDTKYYEAAELPDADETKLSECLKALSDTDREILYLRYDIELSHSEIGAALGISADASRQRTRYAKSKLRELLKE